MDRKYVSLSKLSHYHEKAKGYFSSLISQYLPLSGGTMAQNATITIPSKNLAGTVELVDDDYRNTISPDCIHIHDSSDNSTTIVGASGISSPQFTGELNGNAKTATTATKLGNTAAIGSTTKPVYFNASGTPAACTYTLGKSVPSNAVFTDTDTKNTAGSTNSTSKLYLIGATSQGANPQTYSNSEAYVQAGRLYSKGKEVVSNYDNGTIQKTSSDGNDNAYYRPTGVDFLHYDEGYDIEVAAGFEYNRLYMSNDDGTSQIEYTPYGVDSTHSSFTVNLYGGTNHFYDLYTDYFIGGPDNTKTLGTNSCRWKQLYAATSTIATSDRNEKMNIEDLDETRTKQFIMGLKPSSYQFINNDSGRTHYGMIAQDVEAIMNEIGMTSKDFAGFIKSPKMVPSEEDPKKFVEVEGEYTYGLRYEEFIAPIIKTMQMQQNEIDELKAIIAEMKGGE